MADEQTKAELRISRRTATAGLLSMMALPAQACANTSGAAATSPLPAGQKPLIHSGAQMAVELAPVHIALKRLYGTSSPLHNGGAIGLVGDDRVADVASNGETQNLRHSFEEPRIRTLMTIAEGHYPVIGRRSAGVKELSDLKGKKVLCYRTTTAGFFLHKMLQTVGLTLDDVTIVETPLGEVGDVVSRGEVDAIAIWEPDSEQALWALRHIGEDVTVLSGLNVYHESYNLYATSDALADPVKRAEIVRYTRAIIQATRDINTDPAVAAEAQEMVARSGGLYTTEEVALCFPNVKYVANINPRMLDTYVEEDVWLAALLGRKPRSRDELARLIDTSVYEEAVAGL